MLALVLGAALVSVPAHASTGSELDSAKARLDGAQAALEGVILEWQQTETDLAQARDAAAAARAEIDRLTHEIASTRRGLNDRVVAAYMSGGSFSMGVLLTADSMQDAADRLQYTQSVVQGDADLATQLAVDVEDRRRQEAVFSQQAAIAASKADELEGQRVELNAEIERLDALVADLRAELNASQEAQLGVGLAVVIRPGAIQTCPVAGANSFVDSFGWPRSDGRTHQGTDLIAPYGTPVVSVASGTARDASNSLGGNAVVVNHDNGDWTYYAHLSSFGTMGRVSAGTVIGKVGATGNTGVNHLHFEYHPNGGAAVNPYSMLLAVC